MLYKYIARFQTHPIPINHRSLLFHPPSHCCLVNPKLLVERGLKEIAKLLHKKGARKVGINWQKQPSVSN